MTRARTETSWVSDWEDQSGTKGDAFRRTDPERRRNEEKRKKRGEGRRGEEREK